MMMNSLLDDRRMRNNNNAVTTPSDITDDTTSLLFNHHNNEDEQQQRNRHRHHLTEIRPVIATNNTTKTSLFRRLLSKSLFSSTSSVLRSNQQQQQQNNNRSLLPPPLLLASPQQRRGSGGSMRMITAATSTLALSAPGEEEEEEESSTIPIQHTTTNQQSSVINNNSATTTIQKHQAEQVQPPENTNLNALVWMQYGNCPSDVLPKVLSFAGPRYIMMLSRTNKFWSKLILIDEEENDNSDNNNDNGGLWRTLCEDTYKWKKGRDPEPTCSWREYYTYNPCVPIDYPTIRSALDVVSSTVIVDGGGNNISRRHQQLQRHSKQQHRSIRILLRPGKYVLREQIMIHAANAGCVVTIESMQLPQSVLLASSASSSMMSMSSAGPSITSRARAADYHFETSATATNNNVSNNVVVNRRSSSSSSPSRMRRVRNLLSCRRSDDSEIDMDNMDDDGMMINDSHHIDNDDEMDWLGELTNHSYSSHNISDSTEDNRNDDEEPAAAASVLPQPRRTNRIQNRATLILHTRRHNEPIVRVRRGHVQLVNLDFVHNTNGTDIWNGNAAIQVQPSPSSLLLGRGGRDNDPSLHGRGGAIEQQHVPCLYMHKCNIQSKSGRGVVNIDGGRTMMYDCFIHDCAATGIYVGGRHNSQALIERTDVLWNGNGNKTSSNNGRGANNRNNNRTRNNNNNNNTISRGHSGIYIEQGNVWIRDSNVSCNSLTGVSAISPDNAILHVSNSDIVANGSVQLEMPPLGTISRRRSSVTMTNTNTQTRHNGSNNNNNSSTQTQVGMVRSRSGLISMRNLPSSSRRRRRSSSLTTTTRATASAASSTFDDTTSGNIATTTTAAATAASTPAQNAVVVD